MLPQTIVTVVFQDKVRLIFACVLKLFSACSSLLHPVCKVSEVGTREAAMLACRHAGSKKQAKEEEDRRGPATSRHTDIRQNNNKKTMESGTERGWLRPRGGGLDRIFHGSSMNKSSFDLGWKRDKILCTARPFMGKSSFFRYSCISQSSIVECCSFSCLGAYIRIFVTAGGLQREKRRTDSQMRKLALQITFRKKVFFSAELFH